MIPTQAPLPVGDMYAPYWTLAFYPTGSSLLKDNKDKDLKRANRITGEVSTLSSSFGNVTGLDNVTQGQKTRTAKEQEDLLKLTSLQNYKSEMTVTLQNVAAKFELTMTPPYDVALDILDHRVFTLQTYVLVEWGYITADGEPDQSSGPYVFLCSKPDMSFSEGEISIQLSGTDRMSYIGGRTDNRKTYDQETDEKKLIAIAKDLAGDFKINFDGIPPLVNEDLKTKGKTKSAKTLHPLRIPNKGKVEQNLPTWMFFKDIVRKNGCSLVVKNNTIYIYDPDYTRMKGRYHYRFLAYTQPLSTPCGKFDIPIESFSTEINKAVFSPTSSKSLAVIKPNLTKGEIENNVQSTTTDPSLVTGKNSNVGSGPKTQGPKIKIQGDQIQGENATPREGATRVIVPSRESRGQLHGRQLMLQGASMASIRADVTLPGVVGLVPEQYVKVVGLGTSISGVHRVIKVVHTLGSGGFSSQANIQRHSVAVEAAPGTSIPGGAKVRANEKGCLGIETPTNIKEER